METQSESNHAESACTDSWCQVGADWLKWCGLRLLFYICINIYHLTFYLQIPRLPPKPPVQPLKPPPSSSPRKRILHISDTHIDFEYVPGTNADCDRPLCCRRIDGLASTKDAGAGFWGDTRKCDTPSWTFKNLLATLKEQEKTEGRLVTNSVGRFANMERKEKHTHWYRTNTRTQTHLIHTHARA